MLTKLCCSFLDAVVLWLKNILTSSEVGPITVQHTNFRIGCLRFGLGSLRAIQNIGQFQKSSLETIKPGGGVQGPNSRSSDLFSWFCINQVAAKPWVFTQYSASFFGLELSIGKIVMLISEFG
jgi:hypothetical protein